VLEEFSLTVHPGERVGLVGRYFSMIMMNFGHWN
jgi:hypothetical protein